MTGNQVRATCGLRQAGFLTRGRIVAWCFCLFAFELAVLLFLALWQHGWFVAITHPTSSDFVSFYAAGKLALAGTPALAYDQTAHYLAEQHARVAGAPYQFFFYPPVFLLLCAGLAKLPYALAYAVFEVGSMVPFLLVVRAILRETSWGWLAPVLAFPAVFWTIGLGQNAFLTAALFGGFTLSLEKRPVTPGTLLGLLCYKPHFGLLAPVALLAGRRWMAFIAASVTVIALIALSVALFGTETWLAYLTSFTHSNDVYATGRIDYAGMVTVFGAARLMGFAPGPSFAAQAVATVAMVWTVAVVWRRDLSQPVRAATLLSATLLAVPMALLYDQLLVLVALAWLVRQARATGFLAWEKCGLAAIYGGSLATWFVGAATHVPLGPVVTGIALALTLRRAWSEMPSRVGPLSAPAAVRAPRALAQTP